MATAELFEFPAPIPIIRKAKPKKETKVAPYSEEFESFWSQYPRKMNCSKFEASKAWNKLPAEMQQQALATVPIFARQCAGKDEQYICHPATWVNQRRWETVVAPVQPQATINIDWAMVLKIWHRTNNWNAQYGPEPFQPGCRCPADLLQNKSSHP